MKFAVITDQHFGARNDSTHFLDYYEKIYKDIFFPTIDVQGIKTLLILGDTFDRRKYVNFLTLKRAKEMFFSEISRRNVQVFMLAGNHDTFFKNTNDVNSVDLLLQEYDNVEIISQPRTIYLTGDKSDFSVCMLPWICAENYQESIDTIKTTEASLCCGHLEIAGFAMYKGMHSEEGLSRELFRKFEHTFSGHYHHKSSSDNIYYLGNPYQLTWQDYNDPRGFHIYNTSNHELEFVENTNIMYHKLVYDDKVDSITDILNIDLSIYTNTYVKVVVLNKTNPYIFDKMIANLYQVNPIDVTIAEDYQDLTDESESDIMNEAEDTVTIINKYVDSFNTEGIDNTKLKNVLREIYVEALNLEQT